MFKAATSLLIIAFALTACVSMATIREMQPRQVWTSAGDYDEVGFCIVDVYEQTDSFWTNGVALNVRNRTHEDALTVHGTGKNEGRVSYFEMRCARSGPGRLAVTLRGVESPETKRMEEAIGLCIK